MNQPAAIFLCDRTGRMAEPWADAGYECWCVDIQHSIRVPRRVGNINFVWGDVRTWRPPEGQHIAFVAAFPPCTHISNAGARDFATKGGQMLRDALETFEACRQVCAWSGAPYLVENPVGVLSSIPHIGKPDSYFHPWEYAGYLDDIQVDNTTKKTCLWTGNGFVMPPKREAPEPHRNDCWKATPSDDRADLRAETPRGFARAVFEANADPNLVKIPKRRSTRVKRSKARRTGFLIEPIDNDSEF